MKYFIECNAKFIAERKSIKACIALIIKKGLKNDNDNLLYIVDKQGNYYNSNGEYIEII